MNDGLKGLCFAGSVVVGLNLLSWLSHPEPPERPPQPSPERICEAYKEAWHTQSCPQDWHRDEESHSQSWWLDI